VSRGWVSAEDLTRAIAEQHGVELEGAIEARPAESTVETESFEVHSGAVGLLHTSPTFLDATDLAFELIQRDDPEEMEIFRVTDDHRERVWSYSRERAEEEAAKAAALRPFGYDVTGWQVARRPGDRNGATADAETDRS
jgi:hypothetical protein